MSLYDRGPTPDNTEALPRFLSEELPKIERAINVKEFLSLEETFVVPTNLVDREVRFADGTYWNPGSGRGYYWYDAGTAAWKLLG